MERTDSSSDSNPLSRLPESRSYLHIQVCEISVYPTGRWGDCQSVKRTLDPSPTSVQHMGIDHRRFDVIVSKQLLNSPDIVPLFEQMGGKGMTQSVAASRFEDTRLKPRFFESFLYNCFVKMMPALGYFRSKASGNATRPSPFLKSSSCCRFTAWRCFRSGSATAPGNIVLRSLLPLPVRITIWLREKSTSLTLRWQHSRSLKPDP